MSFILDALRKSDEQRRRGATPTLLTPQAATVTPGRPRTLSYGLLAAALIGAGIVIGSLHPWQTGQPAPATQAVSARPLESSARPPVPVPQPERRERDGKLEQSAPAQDSPPAAQPAPAPAVAAAAAIERPLPALAKAGAQTQETPREPVAAIPREGSKPATDKPEGVPPGGASLEGKVVTFAELPVAIQQEIPQMSISVHAFSSVPRERLVGINARMLREGESVAPGLTLEQITPDGMIMSYKGYRFRRGVR